MGCQDLTLHCLFRNAGLFFICALEVLKLLCLLVLLSTVELIFSSIGILVIVFLRVVEFRIEVFAIRLV